MPEAVATSPAAAAWVRRGPWLVALAAFGLHLLAWDRYGVFRDELYFIACGQRLSWGYVDQPPGIAAVAAFAHGLFGAWVPGLRLLPWIAAAATVYLTGRLAVRLGAGGYGAVLASVAALTSPVLLGLGHLLTMNAFEVLLALALAHVVVTIVKGEPAARWVGAAALAALAVLFKYSAGLLTLALLAGLLLTPQRRALWTRWVFAAATVSLALVLPNLAWQATHGFPFLELVRNGQLHKNAPFSPLGFAGSLVLESGPLSAVVWTGGLGWLLISRSGRPFRFLGIGAVLYLLVLLATRGKSYYFAPAAPLLLAAGAVAWESRLRSAAPLARAAVPAALALQLAFAPLAVPLLPEVAFVRYQAALGVKPPPMERDRPGALPQVYADMHGWQALADEVARVAATLPETERATAVVYGDNYGSAAAVDVLAAGRAPPAVSGHNQYWLWGLPPGRGDPAIVIGRDEEDCGGVFREKVRAGGLPSDPWVRPIEDRRTIWICRGATAPLSGLWPRLRHYE